MKYSFTREVAVAVSVGIVVRGQESYGSEAESIGRGL